MVNVQTLVDPTVRYPQPIMTQMTTVMQPTVYSQLYSQPPQYFTLEPMTHEMAETTAETEEHVVGIENQSADSYDLSSLNVHDTQGNTEEYAASDMTEIEHPINRSVYQIPKSTLSKVLENHGRIKQKMNPDSPDVLKVVAKFCDAKTLGFMKTENAQFIIDSGYQVDTISVKKQKLSEKTLKESQFKCLFCPLIQNQEKLFPVKENLKRHYSKHLNYNRFRCSGVNGCDYASYRNDHVKDHIKKKHPGEKAVVKKVS